MLYLSLSFLKEKLNTRLRNSKRWGEGKARISALSNGSNGDADTIDSIKLTMINICQESSLKNVSNLSGSSGSFSRLNPPQSFNFDFLMSAHCGHYDESLKLLSDCINYFQSNNYFDHQNSPELPGVFEKLSLSILDVELSEIINFWNCHGANYVPSIAYRIRLLAFDGQEIQEEIPAISGHDNNVS